MILDEVIIFYPDGGNIGIILSIYQFILLCETPSLFSLDYRGQGMGLQSQTKKLMKYHVG